MTLSERYLSGKGVDWPKAERFCFNEWSNPDDDELGLQIVRVSKVRWKSQCDDPELTPGLYRNAVKYMDYVV